MQFDLEVKPFLNLLALAQESLKPFGNTGHSYGIQFKKGVASLLADNGAAYLAFDLQDCVKVAGKDTTQFSFDPEVLKTGLARRTSCRAQLSKSSLQFKALGSKGSSYSGDIVTLPFSEALAGIDKKRTQAAGAVSLSAEALRLIRVGVSATRIAATHSSSSEMLTYLKTSDSRLFISCFDDYHGALFVSSTLPKLAAFQMAVPSAYFDLFAKVSATFAEKTTKLSIGGSKAILLSGDRYFLSVPAVQTQAEMFNRVEEVRNNTSKSQVLSFDIEHAALEGAVTNFSSIYEHGSGIKLFDVKKDGKKQSIKLHTSTTYGKLSDTIQIENVKVKKFSDALLDPECLRDSLGVLDGTLNVAVAESPKSIVMTRTIENDGEVSHFGLRLS